MTTEQKLNRLADRLLQRRDIHHVTMAVQSGDGRFLWRYAQGEAGPDGRAIGVQTPFFIASVTKLFIACVIWQLHEEGRLDAARPITGYLPAESLQGLHVLRGKDHTAEITLRHLLGHSSGLADWLIDRPRHGPNLIETLFDGGDRLITIDEIITHVRTSLTPNFPPQDLSRPKYRIRYSDTNYQLLIAIIERLCQAPIGTVFTERLCRPLGLMHTFLPGQKPLAPCEEPAANWAEDRLLDIPLALSSVGDLYSTQEDLLRFMRALISGAVFRSPQTAALMRQTWQRFSFPLDRAAWELPPWPIEYSLGMMRFAPPRWLSLGRHVPGVIGHSGVTGSWLFYCPEKDLYLCGTVGQAAAGAVPFRLAAQLLAETGL